MEVFYYKANPKVCEYLKLTAANRFTFADGCKMLWMDDIRRLDREAWYDDRNDGRGRIMRRYGIVQLLPHEAKAEQDAEEQGNPQVVLPIADDPNFVWYPPKKETPEEPSSDDDLNDLKDLKDFNDLNDDDDSDTATGEGGES